MSLVGLSVGAWSDCRCVVCLSVRGLSVSALSVGRCVVCLSVHGMSVGAWSMVLLRIRDILNRFHGADTAAAKSCFCSVPFVVRREKPRRRELEKDMHTDRKTLRERERVRRTNGAKGLGVSSK